MMQRLKGSAGAGGGAGAAADFAVGVPTAGWCAAADFEGVDCWVAGVLEGFGVVFAGAAAEEDGPGLVVAGAGVVAFGVAGFVDAGFAGTGVAGAVWAWALAAARARTAARTLREMCNGVWSARFV
jgi:hypothetical protein